MDRAEFLPALTALAEREPDIGALILIGSQARSEVPADVYSDFDLLLFTDAVEHYLDDPSWLAALDAIRITFVEATRGGGRERRILFACGIDVDLVVLPLTALQSAGNDAAAVLARGYRVLLDRVGLDLPLSQPVRSSAPDAAQYGNEVNDFFYHVVWTARKLRRGELWTAIVCLDSYLKRLLLRMIEWEAADRGVDVWFSGRFLERWADPDAVARLRDCFAHYEPDDLARKLMANFELYRELARELAAAHDFAYPQEAERAAADWLQRYLY